MSDVDPKKLKVTELREELKARGLDAKGNKAQLVKRLTSALAAEVGNDAAGRSTFSTFCRHNMNKLHLRKPTHKLHICCKVYGCRCCTATCRGGGDSCGQAALET